MVIKAWAGNINQNIEQLDSVSNPGHRTKQFSTFPGHVKFMGYRCGLHNSELGFIY